MVKAIQLFQVVKDAERTAYGGKSYFNLLDQHPDGRFPSFDDSPEAFDDETHASLAPEQGAGHE